MYCKIKKSHWQDMRYAFKRSENKNNQNKGHAFLLPHELAALLLANTGRSSICRAQRINRKRGKVSGQYILDMLAGGEGGGGGVKLISTTARKDKRLIQVFSCHTLLYRHICPWNKALSRQPYMLQNSSQPKRMEREKTKVTICCPNIYCRVWLNYVSSDVYKILQHSPYIT